MNWDQNFAGWANGGFRGLDKMAQNDKVKKRYHLAVGGRNFKLEIKKIGVKLLFSR